MASNTVTTLESNKGPLPLPCMHVMLVPVEKVRANNYNPNVVPRNNMELLYQSIIDNGFCFPIVTIYDEDMDEYVIIDGFHRYTILKDWLEVKQIPVVVLEHNINQRMAATVQFNRARGVHQVELMGDLVQALVQQGATDEEIAKHLGMEIEEVYRLKQITGIAELFKHQTYSKSWIMMEVADGV
jgi:ParB-like chromosome segregation protein Spo0J